MKPRKRILLIMLEFSTWELARAWSYISSYGFIDGLNKNKDVEVTVLPASVSLDNNSPYVLSNIAHFTDNQEFDDVWCWLVHIDYPDAFWEWADTHCNNVVGITMETLQMNQDELAEFPHLKSRQEFVLKQANKCTHVLCADERDVDLLSEATNSKTIFYPLFFPEEYMSYKSIETKMDKLVFLGARYGSRHSYLSNKEVQSISPPESNTDLPNKFDDLMNQLNVAYIENQSPNRVSTLIAELHNIRGKLFEIYLDTLKQYKGNINLPSIFKSYTGRVIDSMGIGVPVLSWRLPQRPIANEIFADNQDICLYDQDSYDQKVSDLICNHTLRQKITINARNKIANAHTSRIRIKQILNWLTTDLSPTYNHTIGYLPSVEESLFYKKFFTDEPMWNQKEPNVDELTRLKVIEQYMADIVKSKQETCKPINILEIGCGRGWLANKLDRYGNVTAIDPIGEVIEYAKVLFPNVEFLTGDASLMLFLDYAASFDVIVSSEVIEHIPNAQKSQFIEYCSLLLKDDGHLILSTPRGDIQKQWEAEHGRPSQPTEDWISEKDLEILCVENNFQSIEMKRAYLLDIYQIWLFTNQRETPVDHNLLAK